ncbi:MAG TPA: cytochrome c [Candidatus Binatia bacterium]|jgi:mono/diheme cytochrome c family protein
MERSAWIVLMLLVAAPHAAAAENHLNERQKLGRQLFEQSCGVCHTRPTLVSGMYGPELSKESAGGNEQVMREFITNGTPRMPGFKYTYSPDQIAAIAAYLKTLPRGTQDLPTARTPARAPTPMQ